MRTVTVQESLLLLNDPDTVDLRDSPELLADGRIPRAAHVTRGILELALDPTQPYHNPVFSSGRKVLFHCASGGRSALAADVAQNMGPPHFRTCGGFKSWRDAGDPIEKLGLDSSLVDFA